MTLPAAFAAFFGPRTGSTSGAGSSGAPGAAHAGVDAARLDHSIPLPHDDPDAWDTVYVSNIPLPPVGTGYARITVGPSVKLDQKSKTGATKPRLTKTGGKATEGTITVRFVQEALPAMVSAAETLYPGSGPFPVRHPKAKMGKLSHIQIESWSDAPDPDQFGEFTWTIKYTEVSMPAQNGKGGGTGAGKVSAADLLALSTQALLYAADAQAISTSNASQADKDAARKRAFDAQDAYLKAAASASKGSVVRTPKTATSDAQPGDTGDGTLASSPTKAARAARKAAAAGGADP